jgi:thioredoxin-dependent peroxiredoxin
MNAQSLNIGDPAPDFALPSDSGSIVRLSDYRGKRVILYFYPRDDTPGCTTQACGFRDHYPQITEKNAVVLGVSPDNVESHRKFKTKHNLPFLLLADTDHRVAEAYGVWNKKALALATVRSHFVIDERGLLEDVQVQVSPTDSVDRAVKKVGASG